VHLQLGIGQRLFFLQRDDRHSFGLPHRARHSS
jgi:hypothetical protein